MASTSRNHPDLSQILFRHGVFFEQLHSSLSEDRSKERVLHETRGVPATFGGERYPLILRLDS
jgi:hypothetical protein